jgi:hypothetical protein
VRRGVAALILLAAATAAILVLTLRRQAPEGPRLPEDAMPGRLLVGFQDDPTLRWGADRAAMLVRARGAGATVIRTTVAWAQAAPRRPAQPSDPFDPAYRLDDVDELARTAERLGMELLISIWGTPAWANGGEKPNRPPSNLRDLEDFAHALADRYSGRHPGYPPVRLFSVWNEPNLEQFLAPQYDARGRSVSPRIYAGLAAAVYNGVKAGNPHALVAIGETSAHGRDVPSRDRIQDSHSPARFAHLLAEVRPRVRFDAWAQHPYPPRPTLAPTARVRWPTVGLSDLGRFDRALDVWFHRRDVPIWITEYGHETRPADSLGISLGLQARYASAALRLAAASPGVRMFVWFVFHDQQDNPWQSGLIAGDGRAKPALAAFSRAARRLDARNPLVADGVRRVHIPALELAYHVPPGSPIEIRASGKTLFSVRLGQDGWLDVPIGGTREGGTRRPTLTVWATDGHGNWIKRVVWRRG